MKNHIVIVSLLLLLSQFTVAQRSRQQAAPVPAPVPAIDFNAYFSAMKWRSIGPFRGGRSNAVSGVVGDKITYYMGTTGGGIWKTEDAGTTWRNISDGYFQSGSVGAIAVSESDPNVIYAGMGEHAIRGVMTHHGDGMYKSFDAGKTWQRIGLEKTQHIARIIVHPKNPEIVWVAAQGALFGPSADRGIYKSIDGGKTWKKVLYVNDKTGAAELSLDFSNPMVLYAAMWEHGRLPWKVISGGEGSGLYKSVDGGDTWQKIHEGLPKELGKMSIAVSRSNPNKVYALIESDSEKAKGGLFVSDNGGKSWSRISGDNRLLQRAWYYIELYIDPVDELTVYVLSAPALRSIDGGVTWELLPTHHGDHHDLWINPLDNKNMVIADDGGASITFNYGKTWTHQNNMPTAQLYRISVDNQFPYRIYAGQQDNTSVVIGSRELSSRYITEASWEPSAGGESAFLAFNPDDPRFVLGGSYLGTIDILDTRARATTNIMAAPIQYLARETKDMKYRFNWNAPIIWSRHEPNTYYHAAQYLLKTTDMGKTWSEASPDLTRNEKSKQGKGGGPYTNEAVGAENYGTISYVMESPQEKGVIWVGSDDGLVHLTRDGGKTWSNVTPAGLAECLINAIEVSPHHPATAYIATTRYKFNDHTPALYKTTDYGKTWVSISRGIPPGAFTRVVREDQVRKDLLFAGTESGVFLSWDGGNQWHKFQLNLPVTPITDLCVHQGNLIASTSGRSFWILDDLALLRNFQSNDNTAFKLFRAADAVIVNGSSDLDSSDPEFDGSHPYYGVNPSTGVVFYYNLPELPEKQVVTLEITDAKGNLVRSYTSVKDSLFKTYDGGPAAEPVLGNAKGLNRMVWNMRYPTMPGVPGVYIESSFRGHKAIPGNYKATLKAGSQSSSVDFSILPNPLYAITEATYREYHEVMHQMEKELTGMHETVNKLYRIQTQLDELLKSLPADPKYAALKKQGGELIQNLKAWDEDMVQRKSKAYDDVENFENKFTANYLFLINHTESDIPRVNQPSQKRLSELTAQWQQLQQRSNQLISEDIPRINKLMWDAGIGALWKQ
ncbi:MAG: glycosyl hydrolase [Cyclobacteriaceae bacterium]|nr:glycosyl hydrolase [Cyclobacteriaceae bacterium]